MSSTYRLQNNALSTKGLSLPRFFKWDIIIYAGVGLNGILIATVNLMENFTIEGKVVHKSNNSISKRGEIWTMLAYRQIISIVYSNSTFIKRETVSLQTMYVFEHLKWFANPKNSNTSFRAFLTSIKSTAFRILDNHCGESIIVTSDLMSVHGLCNLGNPFEFLEAVVCCTAS